MDQPPAIVARGEANVWRELLEQLLETDRDPRTAPPAVAQALSGLDRLAKADPYDPKQLELLDVVIAAVDEARAGWSAPSARTLDALVESMRRARMAGLDALERAPIAVPKAAAKPAAVRRFTASVGMPRMHRVPRGAPIILDDDIDLDVAWAELEAEADTEVADEAEGDAAEPVDAEDSEAAEPAPASAISSELMALARDAVEDIGALGLLRVARGQGRRHAGIERFEQRLLACVDAIAAFGNGDDGSRVDIFAVLEQHLRNAPGVDPMRAFGYAFAMGCLEGADPARAAAAALRQASHREEHAALIDALSLAPHPLIGGAMKRMAQDAEPAVAAAALGVMAFRGETDFGTVALLTEHHAPDVRLAAARCLAMPQTRDGAIGILAPLLDGERDQVVATAMAETLVGLDERAGLDFARRRLQEEGQSAAPLLRIIAVAGGRSDAGLFTIPATEEPDVAWAHAVGWYGSAELGDALAARMQTTHPTFVEAAARALVRIAGPFEGIDVDDDAPFRPRLDPALVGRAWFERRRSLDDTAKLRFGAPLTLEAALAELEGDGARGADRDLAALELRLLTASSVCIEPHDWVARQREQIAKAYERLADAVAKNLHRPGEWPAERLGRRWAATAPWREA